MKITGDYHTHTYASDGRSGVADNIAAAKRAGLLELAVTDHSFSSFIFHMTRKKYDRQQKRIDAEAGGDLKVLHGVEANIIDFDGNIDVPTDMISRLDVLTVGFHRYLKIGHVLRAHKFICTNGYCSKRTREKLKELNTRAFVNAIKKYPVDIIAHLNHRAIVDIKEVSAAAAEYGVYIELNEKHLDAIGDDAKAMIESGASFIVGTDAHSAKSIGKPLRVIEFVKKYNIPLDRVYGINGNAPTFKKKRDFE